ncbi:MAG TPA: EfeM/EfeO family lipoprotein [Pseudolabrys sp.]|nr:EfeM/EfeO family lipoprotein [Pseudolabrys sp.]
MSRLICCVGALAFALLATSANAQSMSEGAKAYKPFVVEHAGKALAGAKKLQAAVKAKDVKAAQDAWIESRRGWEAMETVTAELFPEFDEAVDTWPDAKQGYHAIEAALFAGKIDEVAKPTDRLVADIARFEKKVKGYRFTPQKLLDGTSKLAFEVGESKSKGGESPYAKTSHIDMQENVEGIEAAWKLVFAPTLEKRDAELAKTIHDKIEALEELVKVNDIKDLDQKKVHVGGEELAALMQQAAPKLKLKTTKLEDED